MRNNSGKVLTIFLIVIAILLISLTAISVFFFIQEMKMRETAESDLEQKVLVEQSLRDDLETVKKAKLVLEEKLKESEGRVEELMDQLEMTEGVRDELKNENRQLQTSLETASSKQEDLRKEMDEAVAELEKRITLLQKDLDAALAKNQKLMDERDALTKQYQDTLGEEPVAAGSGPRADVDLKKIIVSQPEGTWGSIISVDAEAEFLIVNLGEDDNVVIGSTVSVYRNGQLLGDAKVTRVLAKMSAADFVAPLTAQDVKQGDMVLLK